MGTQGAWTDLALHTLGWKAFQDLCAHVCEEVLKRPVEIFREAQDGGQDAVFFSKVVVGIAAEPATVQCKFTSKPDEKLRLSDIKGEEESILALVASGQAATYVFITNKSVDAPEAVAIRKKCRDLGVLRPHIFGKQFLTRVIRSSARLRALVPRVYGLGDLSTILDERGAAQTEAVLGHLLPMLKVYVPTQPHVDAIKKLSKYGIVLLLGDPATGKSTIAAILATVAGESKERQCFKADGPEDFIARWNPEGRGGFFWIDDAFGPNQLRDDYVDRWINIIPKVQAALAKGNQFVLTSRLHIWYGAEPKLGSRNIPVLRDRQAIVDVGSLSEEERRQILYNHIKGGSQSWRWKSVVKPHLPALASERTLLPEIARRLGDPAYTRQLDLTRAALLQFVREPKAHLLQTIREMSKEHRAALTLVFLHHGRMKVGAASSQMQDLVTGRFLVDNESLGQAITQLRDSFLVQREFDGERLWSFKHPTIADAVSTILGETEGLIELYLRGTRPEVVLAEAVCSGAEAIRDATIIPEALNGILAEVLLSAPDEPWCNRILFAFLQNRASEKLFRELITANPTLLARKTETYRRLDYDARINVHARALSYGILPQGLREETALHLEIALLDLDTTFLEADEILALIPSTRLLALVARLRSSIATKVAEAVDAIVDEIDYDISAEKHFASLDSDVDRIKRVLFFDADDLSP